MLTVLEISIKTEPHQLKLKINFQMEKTKTWMYSLQFTELNFE